MDTDGISSGGNIGPRVATEMPFDMEDARLVIPYASTSFGPNGQSLYEDVIVDNIVMERHTTGIDPFTGIDYGNQEIPKEHQYDPETGLPIFHRYIAGTPYVGANVVMHGAQRDSIRGMFTAWDPVARRAVFKIPELFPVWSGAVVTAGDVVFYGTLDGYLKAVDKKTGKELYKYKTPSGIIGNVNTYEHKGKQYVAVLSGVGGWAGIGMAAGLANDTDGLGAVGAYKSLANYTQLGGVLTVFAVE